MQIDFPDSAQPAAPPGWLTQLIRFIGAHGDLFRDIGWALLAVILIFVIHRVLTFLLERVAPSAQAPPSCAMPAWQPSADQARLMLRDADALAEEGRFDEAAHMLLLVAIQEIRDRRPGIVAPALTSREIARRPELSPRARAVFSEIAQVVEGAVFGARPLSASLFARCRRAFEQFAGAQSWQDAA